MSELRRIFEDGTLTVFFEGQIDSANSAAAGAALDAAVAEYSPGRLVIDCVKLRYISSSGLRIILKAKKAIPDTAVINVQPEVYEIFELTGFTEMMEIKKGYRVISVEGCEVIGRGANGEVYRTDPETIVKVYLNPDSLPEINRERELARTAFVRGIPTAIPYDVVRIKEGGYGSVFELLNAKSFAKLLKSGEKRVDELASLSVDLLKLIHSTEVPSGTVPDMKKTALGWAQFLCDYLPEKTAQKLCALIEAVPDDNHLMHGDYHIKNIMLQNGECLLIDMDTLCHGNPVFEFASIYNAYLGFSELDHSVTGKFLGVPYEAGTELWKLTLEGYFGTKDAARLEEVERKAALIGHTRIMRRTIRRGGLDDAAGLALIEAKKKHIIELTEKLDTLEF